MNTDQNTRHIYKTEDIDWDGLKAAGISKKQLEAEGQHGTVAARKGNGHRSAETPYFGPQPDNGCHAEAGTRRQRQAGYGNKRSPSEGGGGSLTGKQ